MSDDRKLLAAALKRRHIQQKNLCFDPFKVNSRPTVKQEEILRDQTRRILYVVAGNQSGKSTLGGRETSWFFQETHPYWTRPNNKHCHHCKSENFEAVEHCEIGGEEEYRCHDCKKVWVDWGVEPLTLIVSGKVSKMVTELWEKKIEPFLEPGSYKMNKDGNSLSSVTHKENGNKIIFLSHEKAIKSKDKIQSYVAHFVWIDEMPDHYLYIEEAIQRVTSKLGRIICTFTPKTSNPEVKDMVESVDPSIGKKYQFGKLDNPINQSPEKRAIVMAEVASLPEAVRNAVLFGDWMDSDDNVFYFDRKKHVQARPEDYTREQHHVVSYDPAASGKGGLIMGVRTTQGWHIIQASYTKGGKAYSDVIADVDKKICNHNVIRKIYDSHEAAFILEFEKMRREMPCKIFNKDPWTGIQKHGRKTLLITNLRQAMLDGWLTFDAELNDLFNEFTSAQWNTAQDGIQGTQHYHLLDALQYFVDLIPKKSELKPKLTRDQRIIQSMNDAMVAPTRAKKYRVQRRGRR